MSAVASNSNDDHLMFLPWSLYATSPIYSSLQKLEAKALKFGEGREQRHCGSRGDAHALCVELQSCSRHSSPHNPQGHTPSPTGRPPSGIRGRESHCEPGIRCQVPTVCASASTFLQIFIPSMRSQAHSFTTVDMGRNIRVKWNTHFYGKNQCYFFLLTPVYATC
jgi:hypothetical protein